MSESGQGDSQQALVDSAEVVRNSTGNAKLRS